jgi:ubiquinone/menaquinone biosynthesis C-methylase UbiE
MSIRWAVILFAMLGFYNGWAGNAPRGTNHRTTPMNQNLEIPPSQRRSSSSSVDLSALKTRQQAMWASGDFAVIGTTLQIVGETLCEAADLDAGCKVLDVACGNGNAALAAARRFCKVVGVDYVPQLLERARERALANGLPVELIEGDAEALPFPVASFDAVVSTFGVMFAPDQERAARELVRVVRPGGTIALANWTPEGFIGRLLATVGQYVPPPAGVASPILWGTEARLQQLFPDVTAIRVRRRMFNFRYESANHFIDVFRRFYGPTFKVFAALDPERQAKLADDLRQLVLECRSPTRTNSVAIPAEYLEIVIER